MKTLLTSLLLLQACVGAAFWLSTPKPALKPDNPFSFFGEEIVMNCTFLGKNSSLARFQEGDDNVTEDYLSRPDDNTLVYRVGNTSRFEGKVNCNGIQLYCWHPDFTPPGGQTLHVDYKPDVRNADCVYYNAQVAQCSWDLLPDSGLASDFVCLQNVNVSAFIRISNESTIDCEISTKFACNSSGKLGLGTVDLVIQIHNKKRPNTIFNFTATFDLDKRVKYEPVTDLNVMTVNSQKVDVTWNHSKSPDNIRVRVDITPLNGTGFSHQLVKNTTGNEWMSVEGLNPAVQYRARVDVLPLNGGLWSDSQDTNFTMPSDAPDHGPTTTPGAYSQTDSCSSPGAQGRDVTVFWKELPEEHWNGALTEYVLKYFPRGQQAEAEVRVASSETKAVLPGLDCSLAYTVHIFAFNTWESANFTKMEIPASDAVAPVRQLLVRLSSTDVRAQWNSSLTPDRFTLFWCRKNVPTCFGRPGLCQCEGPVQWQTVPGDQGGAVIQELKPDGDIPATFRFGISTSVQSGSSRIVWEDCIYQANATPTTPPQRVLVMNKTEAVEVTYISDTCVTTDSYAYVKAYRISWCLASNFKDNSCSSGGGSMQVSAMQGGNAKLTELQPWQLYMVQVEALTQDDLFGPPSSPQPAMLLPPSGLQGGQIGGLVSGLLLGIILVGTVIFSICRCRKMKTLEVKTPKHHQPSMDGNFNQVFTGDDEIPFSSQTKDFKNQVSIDSGVGSQTGSLGRGSDFLKGSDKSPLSSPKPDQGYVLADANTTLDPIFMTFFPTPNEQQRNVSVFTVQGHVVPETSVMQADKGLAEANGPAPAVVKEQEGSQVIHYQSVEAALQQAAIQASRSPPWAPGVLPGAYTAMPPPAAPASPPVEGRGGVPEAADGSGEEDRGHFPLNCTSAEELHGTVFGTANKREALEGIKKQEPPEAGDTLPQVAHASPGLASQGTSTTAVPVSLPQEDSIPASSHEEDIGFSQEAAAIASNTALKAAGQTGYVPYPPPGNAPVFSQNDNNWGQNTPTPGKTIGDTLPEGINTNSPAEFLEAPGQTGYVTQPPDNSASVPEDSAAKKGHVTLPEGSAAKKGHVTLPEGSAAKNGYITLPEGSTAKNGTITLPEGSPAKIGYVTLPEGSTAKNGYVTLPEGSAAKAASQEKDVCLPQTPQGFSLIPSNGYVTPERTSSLDA